MSEKVIEIEHLSKLFKKREETTGIATDSGQYITALDDISFSVTKGESVGLIGRNGSGKSTLLKILSGVYPPTKGHYTINGKIIPLLESGLGFHKDLSGYDNILIFGRILGLSMKEIKSKMDEIVEFAEISHFIYMPIKHYSNGMISRLSFSIVPFLKGDILLVDEILAFGDLSFQQKALQYLKSLHSKGNTYLIVSHHINSLITLCNRFVVLQNGKYVNDGPPLKILPEYYEELLLSKAEHRNTWVRNNILERNVIHFDVPFEMDGISVNNVKIMPSNDGNNEFSSHETLVIEFSIRTASTHHEIDIGIIARDIMQNLIFSISAGQNNIRLPSSGLEAKLYLKIPLNLLNAGVFFIHPFMLHLTTKEYRLSEKSLAFRIKNTEDFNINETIRLLSLMGSVKIPVEWEVK
ncbi:MAG: ABC transporter ATP-binding protein [Bacteroidales bacterium]|nr:ABC transporter ATP-binding protein [Bacteroidales bacterium]